jgi:hypothetical protein
LDTVTGNSSTANVTRSFVNTIAFIKYRINITANNGHGYVGVQELSLYGANDYGINTIAGGGFIISSSVTVTCTGVVGIQPGPTTALTVSAASPAIVNVNSNLTNSATTNSTNVILKSGNCTLNVTGDTRLGGSGPDRHLLNVTAAGTVNFVGNVAGYWSSSRGIFMNTGSTGAVLNIVGNLNPLKSLSTAQNEVALLINTVCTVNITGDIYGGFAGSSRTLTVNAAALIYITGNVYGGANTDGNAIFTQQAVYLNIVGVIGAQHTLASEAIGVVSSSPSAINIFSGPFVSGPYGTAPFQCVRMNLIPSSTSYFEFRDSSTNGAVQPGPIAPPARLVVPGYAVDAPAVNNVRFNTVYASGTLTGTLRMPNPASVAFGVPVDNTTGTAVLSPKMCGTCRLVH